MDASRRTWMAAERTWLAWWRTALGTGAVALAVGRLLPGLTHSPRWPFTVLGLAYALLSIALLLIGALRQQQLAKALRQGRNSELPVSLVTWLSGAALLLAIGTLILVAAEL